MEIAHRNGKRSRRKGQASCSKALEEPLLTLTRGAAYFGNDHAKAVNRGPLAKWPNIARKLTPGATNNEEGYLSDSECKDHVPDHQCYNHSVGEGTFKTFRVNERCKQNQTRVAVLGKRMALLSEEIEVLQAPREKEITLENQAALVVQRIVRGVLARSYARTLRPAVDRSAIIIQRIVRGYRDRRYIRQLKMRRYAATSIQRVWSAYALHLASKARLQTTQGHRSAKEIQRIFRGYQGRRHIQHLRGLRVSASRAWEFIRIESIYDSDIVGLAERIDAALRDHGSGLPPSIVLGLLRVVALMLDEDGDTSTITCYDRLRVKRSREIQPARHFTWRDAVSILRRSSKLLRRLRQIAGAPLSEVSPMIYFSLDAVKIYNAMKCDRMWNMDGFGSTGQGSKACQHLMVWVDSLQEVFAHQQNLANNFQAYRAQQLKRIRRCGRRIRYFEIYKMVRQNAIEYLSTTFPQSSDNPPPGVLTASTDEWSRAGGRRMWVVRKAMELLQDRQEGVQNVISEENLKREGRLGNEQMEKIAGNTFKKGSRFTEVYREDKVHDFENAKEKARFSVEKGEKKMVPHPDDVQGFAMVSRECPRIQQSVVFMSVESDLPEDVRDYVRKLGEAEAASAYAMADLQYVLEHSESQLGRKSCHSSHDQVIVEAKERVKEATKIASIMDGQLEHFLTKNEAAGACTLEAKVRYIRQCNCRPSNTITSWVVDLNTSGAGPE